MKFKRLEIQNFRAIKKVILEDLEDIVLIVGQNGVGKSCIFDSIRLLKSSYGGYNPNEWQNWFNEFQLRVGADQINIAKVLKDKTKPLIVSTIIELSKPEVDYLKAKGRKLIEKLLWKSYTNSTFDPDIDSSSNTFAKNHRLYAAKVEAESAAALTELERQIDTNQFVGSLEIHQDRPPVIQDNIILEILFSTYSPDELGIIDYHGAHRDYQKENISSNLNIRFDKEVEHYKGHALYNYTGKYNNVKTEMASSYIKALLAKESGQADEAIDSLNKSLQGLFEKFFPGKRFDGIVPTKEGLLEFPVTLSTGQVHDISDLSSGEKEVLFGYLRLRNQAPRNSVILIDEPELHLNPRLAKQLPEFYYKSIGQELNNQIWLVTHSDAILKESVGLHGFSIYHMIEDSSDIENQVRKISIKKDIESAVIDLIGDISSYQQGNIVVIFEGIESDFDKKMTNSLFPEFEKRINSISAGSKTNVRNLQDVLKKAAEEGIVNKKFISLVDRDSSKRIEELDALEFSWDVYHIENYLLEESFILEVLQDLEMELKGLDSLEKVEKELKKLAERTMPFHIRHQLNEFVASELRNSLTTRIDEQSALDEALFAASKLSMNNISDKLADTLSQKNLRKKVIQVENRLRTSLKSDDWKKEFRGRDVLRLFVGEHASGIRYEQFRNLIISRMKVRNYQPAGMKKVIDKILNA